MFPNPVYDDLKKDISDENPETLSEQSLSVLVAAWAAQLKEFDSSAEEKEYWNESAAVVCDVLPAKALSRMLTKLGKEGTFCDQFWKLLCLVTPTLTQLDFSEPFDFGEQPLSHEQCEAFWNKAQRVRFISMTDQPGERFRGPPRQLLHALGALRWRGAPGPGPPLGPDPPGGGAAPAAALEVLDLSGNQELRDVTVEAVLRAAPALRTLRLAHCPELTDRAAAAAAEHCPGLTALDLGFLPRLTAAGAEALAALPALRHLSLKGCQGAESFCITGPPLQGLDLSLLSSLDGQRIATMITPLSSSLLVLRLSECDVSDETFKQAFEQITGTLALEEVDISWCEQLTSESIKGLVIKCPFLKTAVLRVTETDDEVVNALANSCPLLTACHLARCAAVTDASLGPLAAGPCSPRLRALDLAWLLPSAGGAATVVKQCGALRHLSLQGCKAVDQSFLDLIADGACPFLRRLDLSYCNAVSTEVARALSARRPRVAVTNYYREEFIGGEMIRDEDGFI